MQGRGTHLLWLFYAEWSVIRYAAKRPAYLPKLSVHIVGRVVCLCVYPALFVGSETKRIRAPGSAALMECRVDAVAETELGAAVYLGALGMDARVS